METIENKEIKTEDTPQDNVKVDQIIETKSEEKKSNKSKKIIGLAVFLVIGLIVIWFVGFSGSSSAANKKTMVVKDKNQTMPGFSVENASKTLVNEASNSNSNVSSGDIVQNSQDGNIAMVQGNLPSQPTTAQVDPIFGNTSQNANSNIPVTQLVVENPQNSPDKTQNLDNQSNSQTVSGNNTRMNEQVAYKPNAASSTSEEPLPPLTSSPARQSSYFLFGKLPEKVEKLPETSSKPTNLPTETAVANRIITKAETPKKPPFGTLIPLQTLGAVSTLGNTPIVRLVLTRKISGAGWELPRGTVFVGRASNGNGNRAFVEVLGYLDVKNNAFVRIAGDLQGIDGANGLIGQSKSVNGVWKRVAREVVDKAYQTANTWISRNSSGTNITLPSQTDMLMNNNNTNVKYVYVKPNTFGYLFINDLPKQIQAESAALPQGADITGQGLDKSSNFMTDEEMLDLISKGNPDDIRKALPRIRPEYRQEILNILESQDN